MSTVLDNLVSQPYKHGFVTDIESESAPKGLSEDTIRMISAKKNEPEWLLEWRQYRFLPVHHTSSRLSMARRPCEYSSTLPSTRL